MAYDSFTSSGLVNTASIATGAAAPTAIMPAPKAIRAGKLLILSSAASQPVELFLNWPQNVGSVAPVAGDTGNYWLQPNTFLVIPLSDVGRLLSPQIYARVALASTGSIVANIVY
jgi:hypothetical protein